jgi:CRISPR/Cas system-associated exonuclease Cas4 (RecB family)
MSPRANSHVRVIESSATSSRLGEARVFVRERTQHGDVFIVGASRGAADDLARSIAAERKATIGIHRFSLTELAARIAAPVLAANGRTPATSLGSEAVAARAAFDARQGCELRYFEPVARMPGFPRALARTLHELRLAQVTARGLRRLPLGGPDLAVLLEKFDAQFEAASSTDRATLFRTACEVLAGSSSSSSALVLLDVPLDSAVEFEFVQALMQSANAVLVTVPFGDLRALSRLERIGLTAEVMRPEGETDLTALRRSLFAKRAVGEREPFGDVRFFSAPGEGRECIEIARRILEEVERGVRFEEIAVFVRSPERYAGLLEHAFRRVGPDPRTHGIPAWFERGTRRPHPAGRAFLAILACACEKLSARRFAEYLSLAQVPQLDGSREEFSYVVPDDEAVAGMRGVAELSADDGARKRAEAREHAATREHVNAREHVDAREPVVVDAVVAGSLRAPWKWEALIVESSVIGGDPERWRRRLDGLDQQYQIQMRREAKDDPDSSRLARIERDRRDLRHLRDFALPIVHELAAWPVEGTWGEWLDRFDALAPRILRRPDRVRHVIAELRPMSAIGPVSLEEARDVIADRLLLLEHEPPPSRYGRVFVASPHAARGRSFRVVFVPGLAERMFPQKPHEDPMMLDDELRKPLAADLVVQEDRSQAERLLLRLAVGAASDRLWVSYPRVEIAESRPRVPSFYALDIMRAITGRIPSHEDLQKHAAEEGGASLGWPAPQDPRRAIDDLEHDLAVLRELLESDGPGVRGHAHYLLRLNACLKRSVTARWGRARAQWTPFDGLTRVTSLTSPMLESQRLGARPYSLSALQKFAACPYQFLLSAVYRLERAEEPEPLQKLDPLTRGALFHDAQAEFFRALKREGRLPVTAANLNAALATLDEATRAVADKYHEKLAPAIDRVWRDEIADITKDLRVWARKLPEAAGWRPTFFEYSFGLNDEGRDAASRPDPVLLDRRFLLRGSIDLVEQKESARLFRVTDHKTGKNRTTWKTVIGGGAILQPVLYSLAAEQALEGSVVSGRLFYCTAPGGFTDHEIPINDANRRAGIEALEIVDRAIELGFLPAAPAPRSCGWCDFRSVCGPFEEQRVLVKPKDRLGDLRALREMP